MEASVQVKVALSPGQRVTSLIGSNTAEKQDGVAVNTETILTCTMVSLMHLQILNSSLSPAMPPTP